MRLYLSCFSPALGDIHERHGAITGLLPPLAEIDGLLDLNFSLLLMTDELLFDKFAFYALEASANQSPNIARIFASLRALVDEGFIQLVDSRAIVAENQDFLRQSVDVATRDLSVWVPSVKYHVQEFGKLKPKLLRDFAGATSSWDHHSYGVSSFLINNGATLDDVTGDTLVKFVLATKSRRKKASDNEKLYQIIRPTVENVLANILVAEKRDAYPYAWDTLAEYYKNAHLLAVRNLDTEREHIQSCGRFFSIAFRDCAPRTVSDWINILRDDRVSALRKEIAVCVKNKRQIDLAFARDAIASLEQARVRLGKWKTYTGWLSTGASIVTGTLGGIVGGLSGGVLGSLIPPAIQYGVDALYEHQHLSEFAWLYFRQEKQSPKKPRSTG